VAAGHRVVRHRHRCVLRSVSLFVGDPAEVTVASLPPTVSIPFAAILLLSTVDAYRLATVTDRRQTSTEEGPTCPHCGKPIDETLDFCQWCTEPLDGRHR
jgi:hypothetical protein